MRRFNLVRTGDVSGCSGVGIVAEGAEFTNGKAVLAWFGGNVNRSSTGLYDSIDDVLGIHGHEGRTKIEFIDPAHDSHERPGLSDSRSDHAAPPFVLDADAVLVCSSGTTAVPRALLPAALPVPA